MINNKKVFSLSEAEVILKNQGFETKVDADEYGANLIIKHDGKWLHVIDFSKLSTWMFRRDDITSLAEKAIEDEKKPRTEKILIETLDNFN